MITLICNGRARLRETRFKKEHAHDVIFTNRPVSHTTTNSNTGATLRPIRLSDGASFELVRTPEKPQMIGDMQKHHLCELPQLSEIQSSEEPLSLLSKEIESIALEELRD